MDKQEFDRIFAKANELWETDFFRKHGTAAIQKFTDNAGSDFACQVHSAMRDMESPLEAAFYAWWRVTQAGCSSFLLVPQAEITVAGHAYRADFMVRPTRDGGCSDLIDHPLCPRIVIELDGHDYHEKTRQQVTHRNRRDRDLQAAGWIVMHVSGSEFNAKPETVTEEVYGHVADVMYAAWRKLHGRE